METVVESKASLKTPAYAALSAKSPLAPFTIERRKPRSHEVLIDILYCGVCHSDIHQARDDWGISIFPMVPGHEIVGRVVGSRGPCEQMERGRHCRCRLFRRFMPPLRSLPRWRGAILRRGDDAHL